MRRAYRAGLATLVFAACSSPPEARRAYEGAPPVIPHEAFGASCTECHRPAGPELAELGYAPPSPHGMTAGMELARCRQCHVFQHTEGVWRSNTFEGLSRPPVPAPRAHPLAPPVIPHPVYMREDCLACHDGAAAREEIRTTHPERARCRQCHVEQQSTGRFHEPSTG